MRDIHGSSSTGVGFCDWELRGDVYLLRRAARFNTRASSALADALPYYLLVSLVWGIVLFLGLGALQ